MAGSDTFLAQPVELPPALHTWLSQRKKLLVGGEWVDGGRHRTFTTTNPATETELAVLSLAEKEDVDAAVMSARAVFDRGDWANLPLKERTAIVRRIGDLVLEHRQALAILETLDTGKPIREAYEGDILRAAQNFHFFADYVEAEAELCFRNGPDVHVAFREPLGVVALVTPWNLPLYLETWKIAPALAMGNAVVLKPSELTPLTAAYFAELLPKAGLPAGVFSLVHGFGEGSAGEFLVSHPAVDAISFTGETGTGRAIMRAAAAGPTRVSFELGGKGASVVFEDAAIDTAVTEAVRGAFRNQGQICLATPRVFVHASRYDEFLNKFQLKTHDIVVGDPLDPRTTMGALISQEHLNKVTGYLRGLEIPGRILQGGERPKHLAKGYYLEPTILVDVPTAAPVSREEIFGPVVSLYRFSSEDEVVNAVNDTPYGLSASIWTRDIERANHVSHRLRKGLVWINCWFARDLRVPFGGQKRSGVGREGGKHSLDFFSEWKSVCTRYS